MAGFIPNAKQRKAAKILHHATLHVIGTRHHAEYQDAMEILMECERFVKCGYRMNAQTHFPYLFNEKVSA